MNWAEQNIQQLEIPKTKTKEYVAWGLKLLFTATGLIIGFLAILFLIFENGETDENKEVQKWCAEYMPKLSVRACRTEAGL